MPNKDLRRFYPPVIPVPTPAPAPIEEPMEELEEQLQPEETVEEVVEEIPEEAPEGTLRPHIEEQVGQVAGAGLSRVADVFGLTPPPTEGDENNEYLDDLFAVPQPGDHDIRTDHLFRLDEEDDLSDLVDVSEEDVMGEEPELPPQPRRRLMRRIKRPYKRYAPPTSLGGMNI